MCLSFTTFIFINRNGLKNNQILTLVLINFPSKCKAFLLTFSSFYTDLGFD